MDSFDFSDAKVRPPRDPFAILVNLLTLLVLIAACAAGLLILVVFINPYIGFNPFPPPTLPALAALPTPTPTPLILLPPTWTPTADLRPTPTHTPVPTDPPEDLPTEDIIGESTPVPQEEMSYHLEEGSPVAVANFAHPDQGCDWSGVAGQTTGLNGEPVVGLFVQLGGTLDGQTFTPLTMSGTATQYGPAGYEFVLGDLPKTSSQTLWIQILDQDGPLSDKVYFDTFKDCGKNLILINFNQRQ